jgi:PilZ domain
MQHTHDRRVSGVRRIPVERMVDVCGSSDPASAFQGRSVDISGRGMQVRAAHLPELRTPVVVRFQEQGTEVLAEGEIAWRRACASGGEFGVRFTALDSRSVQTLKALCGIGGLEDLDASGGEAQERRPDEERRPAHTPAVMRSETDHDTDPAPPAALGVRLHIAGLTAPLHAQIKGQGLRSLEVGSQLEFLRVGRSLEIEDLAYGGRRAAFVESVEVSVDQKSRVPELLVSVRYSDAGSAARPAPIAEAQRGRTPESPRAQTPEPQRARSAASSSGVSMTRANAVRTRTPLPAELDLSSARELSDDESDDEDDRDTTPPPLPSRVARAERPNAQAAPRGAAEDRELSDGEPELDSTEAMLQRLDGMIGGVSLAARAAGVQVTRWGGAASRGAGWLLARARRAMHRPKRPPQPRRRTAAPPRSALRSSPLRQTPQLAVQRPRGAEEATSSQRQRGSRAVLWSCLVALVAVSIGYLARRAPLALPAPAAARVVAAPTAPAVAVVASEPSPRAAALALAPPSEPVASAAAQPGSSAARLLSSAVAEDDTSALESRDSSRGAADPGVPGSTRGASGLGSDEFGQGRLHLPVIYRLRLDDVGGTLRGERTATGFEISIPGRRVMESGASIPRRDPRIAKVSTHNGSQGTRVSFRFRETIPAYKVRLRKDVVEFWISSS